MELTKSLLGEGKDVSLPARGNSMLPFIKNGKDRIVLRRLEGIKTGDMLLARVSTGNYVIHRLIDIQGDRLTLKGDGNYRGVEYCSREDVSGTVIAIVSLRGRTRSPEFGKNWHKLPLFVRRPVIAVCKRIFR